MDADKDGDELIRTATAKTILIALDESPVSRAAAETAARLFQDSPRVSFVIVNVAPTPNPWTIAASFGPIGPMFPSAAWIHVAPEPDERDEERLRGEARSMGVPDPTVELRVGDAAEQICQVADERDVDVIVVGDHDESVLRRLFAPSVAEAVVHEASRPVLVVRAAAA